MLFLVKNGNEFLSAKISDYFQRDPLRLFYESLYQQNPNSEMAEFWYVQNACKQFYFYLDTPLFIEVEITSNMSAYSDEFCIIYGIILHFHRCFIQ